MTGYEITFNPFGVPFQLIPSKHPLDKGNSIELVHVDETVYTKYRCRRLLKKQGKDFQLSQTGLDLVN
jgi:hypothetical protein